MKNNLAVKHFLKYLTLMMAIATVSCDNSNDEPTRNSGRDYFPLGKGVFQIYDVTEIQYALGIPETLRYELKTVVTDSFANAEGDFTYVIYRSTRSEGEDEFNYVDTWSARIGSREVIVNEENVSYVKFRLPVREGASWNGNLYNAKEEDTYEMEETNTSLSIGDKTFSDCIIVNQQDNQDFVVFLDQRKETYARNVGLVSKEVKMLEYCSVGSCLGQQQVESGVILKQTIKAHGVE